MRPGSFSVPECSPWNWAEQTGLSVHWYSHGHKDAWMFGNKWLGPGCVQQSLEKTGGAVAVAMERRSSQGQMGGCALEGHINKWKSNERNRGNAGASPTNSRSEESWKNYQARWEVWRAKTTSILDMLSFRWQQNTQETPWNLRSQSPRLRISRWDQIQQQFSQALPVKNEVC